MGKKREGSIDSSCLNVRNVCFIPHTVASIDVNLNQKQLKNQRMFLIPITFQIADLKTIEDVLEPRKCYQCGGETLNTRPRGKTLGTD